MSKILRKTDKKMKTVFRAVMSEDKDRDIINEFAAKAQCKQETEIMTKCNHDCQRENLEIQI